MKCRCLVSSSVLLLGSFFVCTANSAPMFIIDDPKVSRIEGSVVTPVYRLDSFEFYFDVDFSVMNRIELFILFNEEIVEVCDYGIECWSVVLFNIPSALPPSIAVIDPYDILAPGNFVVLDIESATLLFGPKCPSLDPIRCTVPTIFDLRYDPSSGIGSGSFGIVPLPSAGLLAGVAFAALASLRRRRDRAALDASSLLPRI